MRKESAIVHVMCSVVFKVWETRFSSLSGQMSLEYTSIINDVLHVPRSALMLHTQVVTVTDSHDQRSFV
jgi:hypothetical protein